MPYTGKFPQTPKDPREFRLAQMEGQKGFKGFKASAADKGHKSGASLDDDLTVPAKSRFHMTQKLPTIKPPKGNIQPVRGEGPPGDSDQ